MKSRQIFFIGRFSGAIKAIINNESMTCILYRTEHKSEVDEQTFTLSQREINGIKCQNDIKELVIKKYVIPRFSQYGKVNFDAITIIDIDNPKEEDDEEIYYIINSKKLLGNEEALCEDIRGPFYGYDSVNEYVFREGLLGKVSVFYFKR